MTGVAPEAASPTPGSPLKAFLSAMAAAPALARAGAALVSGTLIASGLGMVFWSVAARQMTPEEVGIGAALVSALATLSHAAQLNLRNLIHRFVPGRGRRGRRLVLQAYLVAGVAALLFGLGFVLLAEQISPDLAFLSASPWLGGAFVAALLAWTLYALQEAALTALRQAALVPAQALIYSVLKIGTLLLVIWLWSGLGNGWPILLAWVLPTLLVGPATHVIAGRRSADNSNAAGDEQHIVWGNVLRFFGWDYVGALATSLALGAAPLIVLNAAGPAELANYYLAWSISYLLYLAGRHLGAAMLTEAALAPARKQLLYAEALLLTGAPVLLGAAAIAIGAPWVMMIFGSEYAQSGATLLTTLALASVPGSMVTIYLAICRAESRVKTIAGIQVFTLLVVLTAGFLLTQAWGALGMALAWVFAHCAVLCFLATSHIHTAAARTAMVDFMTASEGFIALVMPYVRRVSGRRPADRKPVVIGGDSWRFQRAAPSLSDAHSTLVANAATGQRAFLKTASSVSGRNAILQEWRIMNQLAAVPIAAAAMPAAIAHEQTTDQAHLLLAELEGTEGRDLLGTPEIREESARLALRYVEELHAGVPAADATIDAEWIGRWIDAPVALLRQAGAASGRADHSALNAIAAELGVAMATLKPRLGLTHGDFSPDNLIFTTDRHGRPTAVRGVIDWGTAKPDGPQGLDACCYLLALRMQQSGRKLGPVVVDFCRHPALTHIERKALGVATEGAWLQTPMGIRSMVLLAWLTHVAANVQKSDRYRPGGYWGLANISLVLRQHEHAGR